MRRILTVVSLNIILLVLVTASAAATSCDPPPHDREATRRSAVALKGVPVAWDASTRRLTVDVLELYKGDVGETVSLFTNEPKAADDGSSIPWQYDLHQPYRIYIHVTDAGLTTGGCSGNRLVAHKTGHQPAPPAEVDEREWRPLARVALPAIAIVGVIGVFVFRWRRHLDHSL